MKPPEGDNSDDQEDPAPEDGHNAPSGGATSIARMIPTGQEADERATVARGDESDGAATQVRRQ